MKVITIEQENKLREKSKPVIMSKVGLINAKSMNKIVKRMIDIMCENNGCGIAAPQVGINERFFLAILDEQRVEIFINPVILSHSEEMETGTEGCISVPEKHGDVQRHKVITIRYYDGIRFVTREFSDMNARIIQHEYDHLDGILYIDKAENIRDVEAE